MDTFIGATLSLGKDRQKEEGSDALAFRVS
jgi:hypothetical protein